MASQPCGTDQAKRQDETVEIVGELARRDVEMSRRGSVVDTTRILTAIFLHLPCFRSAGEPNGMVAELRLNL
jgi:hypothetical protein